MAVFSWLSDDRSQFLVSDDRSFLLVVDLRASDERRFLSACSLAGKERHDVAFQPVGRNVRLPIMSLDLGKEVLDLLEENLSLVSSFRFRVSDYEFVWSYPISVGCFQFVRFVLEKEDFSNESFLVVSVGDVLWLNGVSVGGDPSWVLFSLRDSILSLVSPSQDTAVSKAQTFRYNNLGGIVYGYLCRFGRFILGRFGRICSFFKGRFGGG